MYEYKHDKKIQNYFYTFRNQTDGTQTKSISNELEGYINTSIYTYRCINTYLKDTFLHVYIHFTHIFYILHSHFAKTLVLSLNNILHQILGSQTNHSSFNQI